jgi:DNA polymerase I-like protein with 3'-5' exonuclease and polymerase domains
MLTIENKRFDFKSITLPVCAEGNAKDAYFTYKLFFILKEKLQELGLHKVMESLLVDTAKYLGDIEYHGMEVDKEKVKTLRRYLNSKIIEREDGIFSFKEVKPTDNLASNDVMCEILYTRENGFALYPPDMTDGGNPSVSVDTLELLKTQIEEELEKRGLSNG